MAIEENLRKIQEARYGREVREAIHDAIHECYEDGRAGATDLIAREQIAAERTARETAVAGAMSAITAEQAARAAAVAAEETARAAAITAEENARTAAVAAEQAAREAAVANLESIKADKTQLASPFNFKGSCLFAELPTSGNEVNDTYYVTDMTSRYSWNGTAWYQSGMSEADYTDALENARGGKEIVFSETPMAKNYNYFIRDLVWADGNIRSNGAIADKGQHYLHTDNIFYPTEDFTIVIAAELIALHPSINSKYAVYDADGNFESLSATWKVGEKVTVVSGKGYRVLLRNTALDVPNVTKYAKCGCGDYRDFFELKDGSVATSKLADGSVTYGKRTLKGYSVNFIIGTGNKLPNINTSANTLTIYGGTSITYGATNYGIASDVVIDLTTASSGAKFVKMNTDTKVFSAVNQNVALAENEVIVAFLRYDTGRGIYKMSIGSEYTVDGKFQYYDEVVNIVENYVPSALPSYYDSYMESRIATLQNLDGVVGCNGDAWSFVTDPHFTSQPYAPAIIKTVRENTNAKISALGGDYITQRDSANNAMISMREIVMPYIKENPDMFVIAGNHDFNTYGTGILTESQVYSILAKHSESLVNTDKKLYYYYDNESQKIRYFMLNDGSDGTIDAEQIAWLTSKANEIDETWTIVIFSHYGLKCDTGKTDRTNVQALPTVSQILNALSGASATIACIVSGHCHIDLSLKVNGVWVISTTTNAWDTQSSTYNNDVRTKGTINEQAVDVYHIDTLNRKIYVTRIGGGEFDVTVSGDYTMNDREFSY